MQGLRCTSYNEISHIRYSRLPEVQIHVLVHTYTNNVTLYWNSKHFYFGSHIRTLFCSLFVVVLATVVLAVICADHVKMLCNVM